MEWFQHVEMYRAFNSAVDDRKKILITSQFMDEGPAAAWAGVWCTKELSRSQHNPENPRGGTSFLHTKMPVPR